MSTTTNIPPTLTAALWSPSTEEAYWDALEALPPAYRGAHGSFLLGEPYTHRRCSLTADVLPTYHGYAESPRGKFLAVAVDLTEPEFRKLVATCPPDGTSPEAFRVLGPDRLDLTPDPFATYDEAVAFIPQWVERYRAQGYYRDARGWQINLRELPTLCHVRSCRK